MQLHLGGKKLRLLFSEKGSDNVKEWKYRIGEWVVLNEKVKRGLPDNVGNLVQIHELRTNGIHDYAVTLPNGDFVFVKENELNKIFGGVLEIYFDFLEGRFNVFHKNLNKVVVMIGIDFLHEQVEILHDDESMEVVDVNVLERIDCEADIMVEKSGYFEEKGHKLGKLVDEKQAAYGDSVTKASKLMKVYLENYKTNEGYLIPEELLDHILLQVRIIDKQNRIFSNPKADKMDESPYDDISGYGLLGGRMQNT